MTPTTRMILAVLAAAPPDDPPWGYRISEQAGISPSRVYPVLSRLASQGYVRRFPELSPPRGRPARVHCTLTDAGAQLAEQAASWARQRKRRHGAPGGRSMT